MPARNQIENITPSSTPPFSDPNQSLPSLSSCSRDCLASRPITSGAWFGMWFRSSEPDTTPKDDMPYCENIDSRHVAQTRGLSMRAIPSPCRTVGIIDDHHYRGEGQLRISSAVYALAFAKFSCFSCRVSCIDDLECHRNNAPTRGKRLLTTPSRRTRLSQSRVMMLTKLLYNDLFRSFIPS
ncbi:uncharacterized protein CIMG_10307 [Coccidioides immitis RS]|uniref:Uncharacterized protein n=1 Tax=Coccidioides immitis (strain RS) TaxID=246410 RepID=J3K180_COCIM|nr:uncharacterized protein CIMG_10307 [Coccidioides immitis RS]EAS27702.3 hypothetical protein CIMG_10307 [Coccidioides immitis RS]